MFGFLSDLLAPKPRKALSSYRPHIDALEERWCMDASHITLNATVLANHMVQLSGAITGQHVADFHVTFAGSVYGMTTSDSSGNFSYTTSQAWLGTVYAAGIDDWARCTDTAEAVIAKSAPALSISIAYGAQNNVTVSGTVTDLDAAGRTVTLGGVAYGTVVTDSSGNFSLTTTASGLGQLTATVSDAWWQSATASATLTSNAPVIQNFEAARGANNVWTFTGKVVDESPAGLTVRFGGLMLLTSQTATVDENGNFTLTCVLDPMMTMSGNATAVVTDWWGISSDEVWEFVSV